MNLLRLLARLLQKSPLYYYNQDINIYRQYNELCFKFYEKPTYNEAVLIFMLNDSVGMSIIMSSSPALLSAVCVCCRLCLVPPISGGFSLPEECSGQPPLPLPPDHLLPAHSPVLTTASSTTVASRWSNRKQLFQGLSIS